MEADNLFINQTEIYEALKKLLINAKKESADRKTIANYKRKLDTADAYWQDYKKNHETLCKIAPENHVYFEKDCMNTAYAVYVSLKEYIEETLNQLRKAQLSPKPYQAEAGLQRPLLEAPQPPSGALSKQRSVSPRRPEAEAVREQPGPSSQHQKFQHQENQFSSSGGSKLELLKRKQRINFKALERTISRIQLDKCENKWQFEHALKSLETRWSDVDKLHWEIEAEDGGYDSDYQTEFCQHEDEYSELTEKINMKMWSVKHQEKSTPKMDIPVFNGSYKNWVSFKDLFNEAIDKNHSMSNAQKMQFLKSKISGEAERLIHHLQISSENYKTCWEILNQRYGNKRLIFSTHLNTLLGLPSMQHQSLQMIKKLHDVTQETLHAIVNLGVDITTWDPLVVHLLSQKLDNDTFTEYVESVENPRELPSLQEFLGYLEKKFTALEASRRKQEPVNQKSTTPQASKSNYSFDRNQKKYQQNNHITNKENSKANSSAFHISRSSNCKLCNSEHGLWQCPDFLQMTHAQKLKTITKFEYCNNCLYNHLSKPCQSKKRCRKCLGAHNTLLHEALEKQNSNSTELSSTKTTKSVAKENPSHSSNASTSTDDDTEILLATAVVKVTGVDGTQHQMRALVDQGSQLSLINEKAAQILGLKRDHFKGQIFGVGEKENNAKGSLEITIQSNHNDFSLRTSVIIMNTLIKRLPNKSFAKPSSWEHIQGLQLADPKFNMSRPVDLLLGADVYCKIMLNGILRGEKDDLPLAQQTQFGWLLCGSTRPSYHCNVVLNNTDELLKFWENEDINQDIDLSSEDHECLQFFLNTTKRLENGEYEVKLPFKPHSKEKLGATKPQALAQFRSLERKLEKNNDLKAEYHKFMNEYISLNHMKISTNDNQPGCYLPHHAVTRAESTTTKVRVVFNASAKSSSGHSLNDIMYKGPNIQKDLQKLILRWRQFRYAYTSDIEKMYRMIKVHEDDQIYQRIIWRDARKNITSYQLTTLTYGTKPAGFIAMMCLKQLAADERTNFPKAAKELEECMYMDDYCGGQHTIEKAKQLKSDLINLLKRGGFNLRKWASNKPELINDLEKDQHNQSTYEFKQTDSTKTLGLGWNPSTDNFIFKSKISSESPAIATKRSLLSDISKLFDPIGWLTPLSTSMKLLFQKVWLSKLEWDEVLPEATNAEWGLLKQEMDLISEIKINRWLGIDKNHKIELHGFCDASNKAYACVIYCKINKSQNISIELVAGKARLAPLSKSLSIPRLELMGAVLLMQLLQKVQSCLQDYQIDVYCWTDSTAVLGWIQGDPARWKPFVANRVSLITKTIPAKQWRYVKTDDNPADCASRGLTVQQLKEHSLWWRGPSWLPSYTDQNNQTIHKTTLEMKPAFITGATVQNKPLPKIDVINDLLNKFSSITKIIRILAWILRLLTCKKQINQSFLEVHELRRAKLRIIKSVQLMEFADEINSINSHGKVQTRSKILTLNPFLDENGILRAGGRLRNAQISYNMKHPAILPHNHRLTTLLIEHAHRLTFHGGVRLTLANLRQEYWIVGGYVATKMHVRRCVICKKQNPIRQHQLMGDLPESRINPENAFYHCGVDFTGFVEVKANKGRGIKTTKGYISVFVCMVTKAVHLELVSDMSSAAFLAALTRMAARRGAPRHIYSDNGTNFVGANRMLQEEYDQLKEIFSESFLSEITEMEIQWHFNVPSWPNAGGLWERAVRSLKHHLKRVIGQQKLTFEEYSTLLAKLEACLNSRPLCALSEEPDDFDFLTPAHFLSGRPGNTIIETEHDARTRWHMTSKIIQDLWKRWKTEYLVQLSARTKWMERLKNIEVGDLVVIQDDNLPPGKWALGRVTDTHPGDEGLVRAVTLKTKNGYLKRPIVKLSVLPIDQAKEPSENPVQEPKPENHDKTKPQKCKKSPSLVATLVTTLLCFISIVSSAHSAHEIKQLPNNQTLYFDPIAKVQLIRDKWTLVVYYDMDPYWAGIDAYKHMSTYLDQLCATINKQSPCETIVHQARHDYQEIEYYNELLLAQHFDIRSRHRRSVTQTNRRRRGLINGVGYLANELFGVLDSRFAEQYAKDIDTINTNEKHLVQLWKNQTSVIEAEFNLMKNMEATVDKQHKAINRKLMDLQDNQSTLQREVQNISYVQDFTLTAMAANNLLQGLKRLQDTLIDTITDIYHGQISLHLLTPNQLKRELQTIYSQMPSEVTLPIASIENDFQYIYKLLKIKARATHKYIIIEITFPLVSRENFQLYKLIPVPHQTNTEMTQIKPVSEYVAVNLMKDSYFTVTKEEINQCLVHGSSYLCSLLKPIEAIKSDEDFCYKNRITNKCETMKSTCSNTWIELHVPSQYYFFCCDAYKVKIVCGGQVTVCQLSKAGVIAASKDCIIKGKDFTLYSMGHNTNHMNISSSSTIYMPEIDQINHIVNIKLSAYETSNETNRSLNTSITSLGESIRNLKNSNTEITELSSHDILQYALGYSAWAAIGCAAIVWAWCYCRSRRRRRSSRRGGEGRVAASPPQRRSGGHQRRGLAARSATPGSAATSNDSVEDIELHSYAERWPSVKTKGVRSAGKRSKVNTDRGIDNDGFIEESIV